MYFLKLFLFKASIQGHLDIVNLLIHDGADVNQQNNYGNTALFQGIKIIL